MATRKKTIRVPVNFGNITNLTSGTLTTLGTPTIFIPENSAGNPITFTSAMFYVAQQSNVATSQNITSVSATLTLSGATATTVTMAGSGTNTGEDASGIIGPLDFLTHFNANYGTVTSRTCQVQVTITVSANSTTGAYAWLELTYEYDDSAVTRIQTICIPFESSTTTLPTTATTYATLKQLTGAGGLLNGYASPVIRHRWLEVKGNTNASGTTTDMNLSYNFDGGTTQTLPTKENGGAQDNWVYYQVDSSGLTSTATHTFQLWNSQASRWANIIVNEWVSFEYTVSGTTSVLNYIELPIEYYSPIPSTVATAEVFFRTFILPEPNPSLVKGAIEFQYNAPASVTMQVKAGTQASYRGYIASGNTVAGQYTFNHGFDSDAAGGASLTLAQGNNNFLCNVYRSAGTPSNVSGHIKLLYSSNIAPTGIDSHTSTFYSFSRQMSFTATNDNTVNDSVQIPETDYWLTEAGMYYSMWVNINAQLLSVEIQQFAGEGPGTGSRITFSDLYGGDAEWSFGGWTVRNRPEFKRYPADPDPYRMNIETARNYTTKVTSAATGGPGSTIRYGYKFFTTYNTVLSTISGNITNSGGGTVNIDLYELSGSVPTHLKSTTRSGDGSYSLSVYNPVSEYYVAAYVSDTVKGMSQQATPGTGFDIDLNPSGGGGGGGGLATITNVGSTVSSGTTIDLSAITGLAVGDFVIIGSSNDGALTITLPTGYTSSYLNTGGAPSTRVSYKFIESAGDIATITVSAGASAHVATAFRNVSTVTPVNTSANATGGTLMPNPPSVTTTTDKAMIVAWGFLDDDVVAASVGAPSGYTLASAAQYGSAGNGSTTMAAYLLQTVSGSEDPAVFTATGGDDAWTAHTMALTPTTITGSITSGEYYF